MDCNQYYSFSPGGIFCSIGQGLVSGATAGLGQSAETLTTELTNKMTTAAKEVFTEMKANTSGNDIGDGVNNFISEFLNGVNVADLSREWIRELNKGYETAFEESDLTGKADDFLNLSDDIIERIRESFMNNLDESLKNLNRIAADTVRDSVTTILPWMILASVATIGSTLGSYYLYKKMVHDIGKPKLASEVGYAGIIDRTIATSKNVVSRTLSSTYKVAKYAAIATATGLISCLPIGIGGVLYSELTSKPINPFSDNALDTIGGFFCVFDRSLRDCGRNDNFQNLIGLSLALSASAVGYQLLKEGYSTAKDFLKKKPLPIFSEEVSSQIDDITQATYNLQKHGSYQQNLLLYGPGGTGKTMVSEMIAKNAKMNYIMMSGGDLAQFVANGTHIEEVEKLFSEAESHTTPTIIFIDECESILRDRDKITKAEMLELQNKLLNKTGKPSKKIMLILTTNRVEDLDEAILDRMDNKLFIGPPGAPERKKMLEQYANFFFTQEECQEFFSGSQLDAITEKIQGFTGRRIFKMLNALASKKAGSKNNGLTREMVDLIVQRNVDQEAGVKGHRAIAA